MPGPETIKFGGVLFNRNEISNKYTEKQPNGQIKYSVFLKNGVSVKYLEQSNDNKASTNGFVDDKKNKASQTFRNLNGAEISGTSYLDDYIELQSCQGCSVDVRDNYGSYDTVHNDYVTINDSSGRISKNNKISTDANDYVQVRAGKPKKGPRTCYE